MGQIVIANKVEDLAQADSKAVDILVWNNQGDKETIEQIVAEVRKRLEAGLYTNNIVIMPEQDDGAIIMYVHEPLDGRPRLEELIETEYLV